ncbi:MAG: hypothetical protein ACOCXG_01510 [Nanoarchaeota archaeon]
MVSRRTKAIKIDERSALVHLKRGLERHLKGEEDFKNSSTTQVYESHNRVEGRFDSKPEYGFSHYGIVLGKFEDKAIRAHLVPGKEDRATIRINYCGEEIDSFNIKDLSYVFGMDKDEMRAKALKIRERLSKYTHVDEPVLV